MDEAKTALGRSLQIHRFGVGAMKEPQRLGAHLLDQPTPSTSPADAVDQLPA
jgi:hypothetical protein